MKPKIIQQDKFKWEAYLNDMNILTQLKLYLSANFWNIYNVIPIQNGSNH